MFRECMFLTAILACTACGQPKEEPYKGLENLDKEAEADQPKEEEVPSYEKRVEEFEKRVKSAEKE